MNKIYMLLNRNKLMKIFYVNIALVIATICGCNLNQVPSKYFVVSASMEERLEKIQNNYSEKSREFTDEILAKDNLTVGFIPPQSCLETGPSSSNQMRLNEIRCQSLVSQLEKTAATQGYNVIDWKLIHTDPYRSAVERKIDLLFMVEEFIADTKQGKKFIVTDLEYSEQQSAAKVKPYSDNNDRNLNKRCKAVFESRKQSPIDEKGEIASMGFSAKMILVENGLSQWFYRRTISLDAEDIAPEKQINHVYYLSRGAKERGISKIVTGSVFIVLGLASSIAGSQVREKGTSLVRRNVGVGLSWFAIIPYAIGIPIAGVGVFREAAPTEYEPAENIICKADPIWENPFLLSDESSENKSSKNQSQSNTDHISEQLQQTENDSLLIDALVKDFFSHLDMLKTKDTSPPVESTEPIPSIQSTEPIPSIQPTEPIPSIQPTEPIPSIQPTEATKQTPPTQQTQPIKLVPLQSALSDKPLSTVQETDRSDSKGK